LAALARGGAVMMRCYSRLLATPALRRC